MSNPILRIHLPIQSRFLDIDILVLFVKFNVADCGGRVCEWTNYRERREEGRYDEVHILPSVGKETDHTKERERCHVSGVVVARETGMRCVRAR